MSYEKTLLRAKQHGENTRLAHHTFHDISLTNFRKSGFSGNVQLFLPVFERWKLVFFCFSGRGQSFQIPFGEMQFFHVYICRCWKSGRRREMEILDARWNSFLVIKLNSSLCIDLNDWPDTKKNLNSLPISGLNAWSLFLFWCYVFPCPFELLALFCRWIFL